MMGRRSGRAAAKRAAAALESAPKGYDGIDDDDEPSRDIPTSEPELPDPEPEAEAEADDDDAKPSDDEANDDEEVDNDEEEVEEERIRDPTPQPTLWIRKKRLGRPPKNRPPDDDGYITVPIDADTPRRGRGRGGRGRAGRRGPVPTRQEQPIDKEGAVAEIVDDECVLPEDADGETKVDKLGNLQGGRDYRCRTFTVLGRGARLYMLSTEPARCVGFRDSYLFFTKHMKLHKVLLDNDEKLDMIDRDLMPHSYKGRSIGVVTARSVFREFGARIIIGGRTITDDYDVAGLRALGATEGQLADPDDIILPGQPYNKNQYVAWHGASAVYHQSAAPLVPAPTGRIEPKKRRVNVNDTNWMLEHAREASRFNSEVSAVRRANTSAGVYDVHTNQVHLPASMQPTHARIVPVPIGAEVKEEGKELSKVFPPVPPVVARNFTVHDVIYETPKRGVSHYVYENHDPNDFLAPFRGLSAVSSDIKALLPPECVAPFEAALKYELEMKAKLSVPEAEDGSRRHPIIDKDIVPYAKAP